MPELFCPIPSHRREEDGSLIHEVGLFWQLHFSDKALEYSNLLIVFFYVSNRALPFSKLTILIGLHVFSRKRENSIYRGHFPVGSIHTLLLPPFEILSLIIFDFTKP